MSEEKRYLLIFEQIQPLHIGAGSYGVVNETRIFIPGWTMWGALTNAYSRIIGENPEVNQNQKLFEKITCFYPSFYPLTGKDNENVLFPAFKEGKLHLGQFSEDRFRVMFVDTFVSTAINPAYRSAKDESLHEINIILPKAKSGYSVNSKEQRLYWIGAVETGADIPDGIRIVVGGDVRYGFGEMILKEKKEITEEDFNKWLFEGADEVILRNYLPVGEVQNAELLEGKTEAIVKLEKSWGGANLRVTEPEICFAPGSKIKIGKDGRDISIKRGILTTEKT